MQIMTVVVKVGFSYFYCPNRPLSPHKILSKFYSLARCVLAPALQRRKKNCCRNWNPNPKNPQRTITYARRWNSDTRWFAHPIRTGAWRLTASSRERASTCHRMERGNTLSFLVLLLENPMSTSLVLLTSTCLRIWGVKILNCILFFQLTNAKKFGHLANNWLRS